MESPSIDHTTNLSSTNRAATRQHKSQISLYWQYLNKSIGTPYGMLSSLSYCGNSDSEGRGVIFSNGCLESAA
eukprot:scaffold5281_cov127-Cylindrotheca_fusiformis.AAC.4